MHTHMDTILVQNTAGCLSLDVVVISEAENDNTVRIIEQKMRAIKGLIGAGYNSIRLSEAFPVDACQEEGIYEKQLGKYYMDTINMVASVLAIAITWEGHGGIFWSNGREDI